MIGVIQTGFSAEPSQAASSSLEPARARFRDLLFARIIAFEEFRKSADRPAETAEALVKMSDLAHKIAGVGATLGYSSAGALAAVVEKAVLSGRAGQVEAAAIWSDVEPRLDALLDALETLLDD